MNILEFQGATQIWIVPDRQIDGKLLEEKLLTNKH